MTRRVLRGALVLPNAGSAARHADILIDGELIEALLEPGTAVDDAISEDATGMLVHAGLVNAHMHAHTPLTKGLADRWSLEILLASGMRIYGPTSLDDRYVNAQVGAVELLTKGCTTVYDMCLEAPLPTPEGVDAVARAYADVGMRAVIAPMISDRTFFEATTGLLEAMTPEVRAELERMRPPDFAKSIQAMRRILSDWSLPRSKVRLALAPTIPMHCTDEFLLACKSLSDEFGVGMQSHLQESKVQALSALASYGRTAAAQIDELGLIGPGFVAAHGVWLDDDDMQRLGSKGAHVSHNPGSNAILGSGIADVRRMLELGINVAIGTDGANCSDNLNMYEAMRAAARLSHLRSPDLGKWLSAQEIFFAATEGGARAAGFSDIGQVAAGFKADLVMLDLSHPNWIPTNDVLIQLVQSEDGNAVHSVMIDGKWAVRERVVVNVQVRKLAEKAALASQRLREAGRANDDLYRRLAPVVSCFCPALMRDPYRVERFGTPPATW